MENSITTANERNNHPSNIHLDIKLEGWSLTTDVIALCVTSIALYSIYAFTGKALPFPRIA